MRTYTYAELYKLPTLATGQGEDLKIDVPGQYRIWLSRVERGLISEEVWDPNGDDGRGAWLYPTEYRVPAILPDDETGDEEDEGEEDEGEGEPSDVDETEPPVSGQWRLDELPRGETIELAEVHSMVPAPYNDLTIVTPDIARAMLDRYTPLARPLDRARVEHYIRVISPETPDPDGTPLLDEIAVSATGHTVAGQPLLFAVIETGMNIKTIVRRNHPGPARLYADGADPAYMARTMEALNDRNSVAGTRWYLTETGLSSVAHDDGKLRRIELWHMTDEAARLAGLLT